MSAQQKRNLNKVQRIVVLYISLFFAGYLIFGLVGCARYVPQAYVKTINTDIQKGELFAIFYGTSTLLISDGEKTILIDGFFSRQGFWESFFKRMKPDNDAIAIIRDKSIDYLLVAHSHFDHARDSAQVAILKKSKLYGSANTSALKKLVNPLPEPVTKPFLLPDSKFRVTLIESDHVQKSSFLEILEKAFLTVSGGSEFIDSGKTFSFHIKHGETRILIVPSANFPKEWAMDVPERHADIVFLSIGLLGEQKPGYITRLWKSTVVDTCAKLVIPIHWDDFRRPLDRKRMVKLPTTLDIVDDISAAMRKLNELAKTPICNGQSVKILFPEDQQPFGLDSTIFL
ncbi:hypothetical protein Q4520_18145 [Alteromonas sp. 1_MG-2023]|uniref:MBL fold metallo-hydrolase n=1 Tax=Alteromonas sp. 1_MG-2023 TaxID=3062669 RepID=UPI0026E36818|nr:hypothetical protein [Alteromonas sp. 1_MG-2023]MDO6477348.1 hypothetical protein [Alteromonas sp. 1_MG-2023]